ncbi:MAG: aminoglycoside phosphotransferase, partial [Agromyces sp.]|nr:aminoglycoside phosphotransferase [Agromyces sp.]
MDTLALSFPNSYNPNSMNSVLEGERPRIAGRVLTVDPDGRVLVDGVAPAAGDGVALALAASVVDKLAGDAVERPIAVDQTNTSVIVGDRLVVKLVGRWAAADRAGRLLERLAAVGSDDVARLHGRVEWRHPRLGTSTLAIVTEYLPGAEDGWTWAVDDVVAVLGGAADPEWPALLGARTAHIHDVLGADATPAGTDATGRRLARSAGALRRALAAAEGPVGARLRNRRASLERDIRSLGET